MKDSVTFTTKYLHDLVKSSFENFLLPLQSSVPPTASCFPIVILCPPGNGYDATFKSSKARVEKTVCEPITKENAGQ